MMEHHEHAAESCRDRSSTRERFHRLTHVYRSLQTSSCPRQSAAEVAGVIFSGVCGGLPGEDREHCHDNSVELTYISVTLVEKITSSLTSQQSLPPAVASFCLDTLRMLFQDMDLMSLLVHQFQAEDQIISHLAAKSVSACVLYHLHENGAVSPAWEQRCVQVFHSSAPGPELDACLWSLTEVLKRLLKGAHHELFGKLVAAFDSSLNVLCSKFLPEARTEAVQCLMDLSSSSSRDRGTTFCLLLDLLEVLTASSVMCGAGVCLQSQRLVYTHSSALLTAVSCSSQYFVKKRAMLLLKRSVLQKAGEDWTVGGELLTGLRYEFFSSDMSTLAHSVLTTVAADWLHSVQVESSSFFGGTRHIRRDEGQKADCVMLRAVSLLLLKSMELHIQTATGVDGATDVYGYLQSLWGFLKRNSAQLKQVTHLCCWVSLLFGEQDDDMMEAAKALLSVFLHHRLCSGLDDFAMLEAACASGCNPHCHFLLLLQSISFDHSILLDFLISTETCFLEYFVRYLKYLRADWQGFTVACGRISVSHRQPSLQKSLSASLACKAEPDRVGFQPAGAVSPVETISVAPGLRLVEYGSSDESDPESMDTQGETGTSGCEKSSALNVNQDISGLLVPIGQKQHDSAHSPGLLSEPQSTLERGKEGGSSQTCPNMAPLSGQVISETLARAVVCLSELREVVTRLHTKKLFPYNPSSLLKLLTQVQNCSQQSHPSHFNK